MFKPTMTLASTDWSRADFASVLISDSEETPAVAADAADLYAAWWINNLHTRLPGWTWKADGTFSGPARDGVLQVILGLDVEATDYVIEHLPEIRAEIAKAAAANSAA